LALSSGSLLGEGVRGRRRQGAAAVCWLAGEGATTSRGWLGHHQQRRQKRPEASTTTCNLVLIPLLSLNPLNQHTSTMADEENNAPVSLIAAICGSEQRTTAFALGGKAAPLRARQVARRARPTWPAWSAAGSGNRTWPSKAQERSPAGPLAGRGTLFVFLSPGGRSMRRRTRGQARRATCRLLDECRRLPELDLDVVDSGHEGVVSKWASRAGAQSSILT
jgi:hypothetical protein